MISMIQGEFRDIPFESIMDRTTGRVRVRMVDITRDRYMIARRYMLRLRKDDFEDPSELAKFASTLGITLEQFQQEFERLVQDDPVPRAFYPETDPPRASLSPERMKQP